MSDTTAGWYADPAGTPQQRWWDGSRWTHHVQPAPFVMSRTPLPSGKKAEGGNSPARNALIVGIAGLVLNALLLPSIVAVVLGVAGLRRADGRLQAVCGIVLGVAGFLCGVLPALDLDSGL